MRSYSGRALAVGSGFHMNPSPGNIRDGLIADAMKSAGAAEGMNLAHHGCSGLPRILDRAGAELAVHLAMTWNALPRK